MTSRFTYDEEIKKLFSVTDIKSYKKVSLSLVSLPMYFLFAKLLNNELCDLGHKFNESFQYRLIIV